MILICYDGSADAKVAIKQAASLLDEPATVLTVWHPTFTTVSGSAGGHAPVGGAGEIDESDRARLHHATRCAAEGTELARDARN